MLTPRQQVAELYWRYPQPHTFDTDEQLYKVNGYVLEGDDYFLMGRGVNTIYSDESIMDPCVSFPRSEHDAWFIHVYCGPLNKIYSLQPYILPAVGWVRRGGDLRFYNTEEFRERVERLCASKPIIFTATARKPASSSASPT